MFSEWKNNQPLLLQCADKWQETADTVSIKLINPQSPDTPFNFKPGQFISLGIELDDKMEYRAYSISSMPGECFLKLTIKLVPDGLVSTYLVEQLVTGERLSALAPTGPFNHVDCVAKPKALMLSAGCGITPVMSMAKTWLRDKAQVDMTFIHMAKSPEQTIYLEELELLDNQHSNFNLQLLLKDNRGTRHVQGRLDKDWLKSLCPDIVERTVYLCGPAQFMQDMAQFAEELGVAADDFFQESFTPTQAEALPDASGVVQFDVPAFGVAKEVAQGVTLADVLEESGVPIIIACRSGMCGSCKCQVTKGEVTRTSTETLTEEEIAQGYTLACSSQIQSDVEVAL
ncbi:hybrid-cluster NAD(P)-dependent oxidoreductase [Vibrio astriarenae]|uniref:hybrid-cluster NAD(P)-dependent oxidoreductase n=1 Tax=Vibrio astriarenae TaxID=1481923 RepID=UPI003736CA62